MPGPYRPIADIHTRSVSSAAEAAAAEAGGEPEVTEDQGNWLIAIGAFIVVLLALGCAYLNAIGKILGTIRDRLPTREGETTVEKP